MIGLGSSGATRSGTGTFEHGADFIVAGMFDFQVEADVRTAIDAIEKGSRARKRPWHG